MNNKPISPLAHGILDYALVGSLFILPALFGFKKKVRAIYAAEGLGLLGYVALSDTGAAVKPLIPFKTHGKVDPFNIAGFALQSFAKPIRKDKNALIFNIAFTVLSGLTVVLTDYKSSPSVNTRV